MRTQEDLRSDLLDRDPQTQVAAYSSFDAISVEVPAPQFRNPKSGFIVIQPRESRRKPVKAVFGGSPFASKENVFQATEEEVGLPGATTATLGEWPRLWQHPEAEFAFNVISTLLATATRHRGTKPECMDTIYSAVSGTEETAYSKFARLVRVWKRETKYVSDITEMVLHPSYQEIIGMGPFALPHIFRELADDVDHWFPALRAISGADVVPANSRGDVARMRGFWLDWGRANGYIR